MRVSSHGVCGLMRTAPNRIAELALTSDAAPPKLSPFFFHPLSRPCTALCMECTAPQHTQALLRRNPRIEAIVKIYGACSEFCTPVVGVWPTTAASQLADAAEKMTMRISQHVPLRIPRLLMLQADVTFCVWISQLDTDEPTEGSGTCIVLSTNLANELVSTSILAVRLLHVKKDDDTARC